MPNRKLNRIVEIMLNIVRERMNMTFFIRFGCLALLFIGSACRGPSGSYSEKPGNLFIREKIGDFNGFKSAFLSQRENLKDNGFSAYSFHRDLYEPDILIVTLKCVDLKKAIGFVRSASFLKVMEKASVKDPVLWAGEDVVERKYEKRQKVTGGIVIANNQVRSYDFWKTCFDAEGGHKHAERGYIPSHYSIHHQSGKPDVVLVVHEASDIAKAPIFMTSDAMRGVMESTGVTKVEIWYGINLEEGSF